jgi:hypothetical protein
LLSLFDVRGEGQLKAIVDRLFERRATERSAQFADCLGKRFGAVSASQPPAPIGTGRVRRWLARIWRGFPGS